MKIVNRILLHFLIFSSITRCISFTESIYNNASFEEFQSTQIKEENFCQDKNLEYTLYKELQKKTELEYTIQTNGEDYKFQWTKTDYHYSSFITPLNELGNYGLLSISLLAWVGIIPNYQERKINILI